MDVDGSGQIDVFEFRKGLQKAGFTDHDHHRKGLDRDELEVTVEDTVRLFNYFDKNSNGFLSYSEFIKILQDSCKISYHKLEVAEKLEVTR